MAACHGPSGRSISRPSSSPGRPGHLITTRVFGRDSQAGVVGGVSSAFSNIVLIGIPFMLGVFGQPGFEILSLLISVHLPIMIMASIILFEIFGRTGEGLQFGAIARTFIKRVSTNPLIIGILAGLVVARHRPDAAGIAVPPDRGTGQHRRADRPVFHGAEPQPLRRFGQRQAGAGSCRRSNFC